jgi:bis(5'-nucleosidyl)-tetraphosphatase
MTTNNPFLWFEKQDTKGLYYNKVSAFKSLSFKGKRGYSTNILERVKTDEKQHTRKSIEQLRQGDGRTHGGILIQTMSDNTEKYALVQGRYTGKWSFPKGHLNKGETSEECAKREIAEETGIEDLPEPSDRLRIGYGTYYVYKFEEELPLIPQDNNEIMETKWVSMEEMNTMALNADASYYVKAVKAVKAVQTTA